MHSSISKKLHSLAVIFLGLTSLGLIIEYVNTQDSHYIAMLMISGFSAMSLSILLLLVYNRLNTNDSTESDWERVPHGDAYFEAINELNRLSCGNRPGIVLLEEVLVTGCRYMNMQQGRVSCTDLQDGTNTVSINVSVDAAGNALSRQQLDLNNVDSLEPLVSSSIVINKHYYGAVGFYCSEQGRRPVTQADRSLVNVISTMIVSILENEAEKKRAEAEGKGEIARQSRNAFIRNLSHELRTPLTDILGYSEMLLDDVTDKQDDHMHDNLVADIMKIRKASSTLLSLVNDVLDLSSMEHDQAGLNNENHSAEILVKEVAESVRPFLEARKNSLTVDIVTNLGFILTDANRCRQALLNMVSVVNKMITSSSIELTVDRVIDNDREYIVFGLGKDSVSELARRLDAIVHYDESKVMQEHTDFSVRLAMHICEHYANRLGGELIIAAEGQDDYLLLLRLPVNQSNYQDAGPYLDYAMMNLAS